MAQMDMGLASWTPLSEAQRMLNSLAASRQPAGAPEQCGQADKSDAGQDLMPASWRWYVDLEIQTAEMWIRA